MYLNDGNTMIALLIFVDPHVWSPFFHAYFFFQDLRMTNKHRANRLKSGGKQLREKRPVTTPVTKANNYLECFR